MSEQNTEYSVPQSNTPEAYEPQQARMATQSSAVPENPSGDMGVKTPYDYLKAAFDREVSRDPITLGIPMRPGIAIEFDTNITSEQFETWRKQATVGNRRARRGGNEDMDNMKFAALVIFYKANVLLIDGQEVYLDSPADTKPLNFFEQATMRQIVHTNATTDTELVRAVYANDAHVLAAGGQIIEAAGYGEEVPELTENPTKL